MTSRFGRHDILVHPDELIAFAWSAPMRDLAVRVGMSDVGLKKLLKGVGVVTPPQGHWNKVHAGRNDQTAPRSPPRRPGETGRLRIDSRFEPFIAKARPLPASGPFATAAVPEDLEELRSRELKALGKVTVPRTPDLHHAGLDHLIAQEDRRRQRTSERSWNWDPPRFDNPVDQRRLRLLNAVFLALAKRGHGGDASANEHEIHPRVRIGDTWLGISIEIAGKHRTVVQHGYRRPDPALPANTPLILRIKPGFDREVGESWQDESHQKLESRIAEIAASLIVAGEAQFRQRLRQDEELAERERIERERREEQERVEREQRRPNQIRKLHEQRIADLQRSGELLRLSRDIRALVAEVRELMGERADIEAVTVDAWERCALDQADKLDPVLSGQIFTHLYPPVLPESGRE